MYIEFKKSFYKVVRETKQYYFLKELENINYSFMANGVIFLSMGEKMTFKYYTSLNANEQQNEIKIYKKNINNSEINNEDEIKTKINNVYYVNGNITNNYDNSIFCLCKEKLKELYNLKNMIYGINSEYITKQIKNNYEPAKDSYKKLKNYLSELQNKQEIINLLKIEFPNNDFINILSKHNINF